MALVVSSPSWGQRSYDPPLSVERSIRRYDVAADATYAEELEESFRIRTAKGVVTGGTQDIEYIGSEE